MKISRVNSHPLQNKVTSISEIRMGAFKKDCSHILLLIFVCIGYALMDEHLLGKKPNFRQHYSSVINQTVNGDANYIKNKRRLS